MKSTKLFVFIITALMLTVGSASAYAASAETDVTFGAGPVKISEIHVASFGQITLTGINQSARAAISDFTVTDPRGNAKGWSVQVSATRFKNGTNMLHDGALTLSGAKATVIGHSDEFDPSYIASPLTVTEMPKEYIVVPSAEGKGSYKFSDAELTLDIWPKEAMAGTYTATITFEVIPNLN